MVYFSTELGHALRRHAGVLADIGILFPMALNSRFNEAQTDSSSSGVAGTRVLRLPIKLFHRAADPQQKRR
jgi:hypothetical protein